MFERFLNFVRSVLSRLITQTDISNKLNLDVTVSSDMQEAIELWSKMYENKADWLNSTVQSLNLPATIASEIARMITLEFGSEITGSARADFINDQYQQFLKHIRQSIEYGCAKGGVAFKPYPTEDGIAVDVVQADRFFPTSHDSTGRITGAVFVENIHRGKEYLTRLEAHEMTSEGYVITNKAFSSKNKEILGHEISLDRVFEWAGLEPQVTIKNINKPLFGYYKVAQANVVDSSSPLGESVYARAVDVIKEADKQYSRLLWEYEGGELAVDIDATLFEKDKDGRPIIPHGKKRLFRSYNGLGLDSSEGIKVFSPQLRDANLANGLNEILTRIEDVCSLSRGTLSNVNNEAKTATELKIMKQRTYSNIKDNQRSLESALNDLIYAIDTYATLYELAPGGEYETSYKWDDSIIMDAESERDKMLAEVSAGILRPEVYLAETRGISEEEAKKLLPELEQLINE